MLGLILLIFLASNHKILFGFSTNNDTTISILILSGEYNPFQQLALEINQICASNNNSSLCQELEYPSWIHQNYTSTEFYSPNPEEKMRIEEAIASVINQACLSISQQGLQIPFDYDYCHNDNFRAALEKAVEENPSLYQHIISMSESYFSKYNNTYENNNPINSIQFRGPPAYSPQSVTVKTGTTIEWTNYDKYPHSVTSGTIGGGPTPMFDSSVLDQNQSYKFTFNKPGIFPYYDTISNIMSGVVIVK